MKNQKQVEGKADAIKHTLNSIAEEPSTAILAYWNALNWVLDDDDN